MVLLLGIPGLALSVLHRCSEHDRTGWTEKLHERAAVRKHLELSKEDLQDLPWPLGVTAVAPGIEGLRGVKVRPASCLEGEVS